VSEDPPALRQNTAEPAGGCVPWNRYVVFFTLAIAGCLVDLATKSWIFNWLGMPGERPIWWIWPGVLGFETSLNEGALFGLGQGMVVVFAILSVLAAIGVLYWLFIAGAAQDFLLTVALGLVTAGIFGNLYDRLGLPDLSWNYANALHQVGDPVYAVRDWILVLIGRFHWPNFNIADSLLVSGAFLLVWHALRQENVAKTAPDRRP
jgi:signal peptidase II